MATEMSDAIQMSMSQPLQIQLGAILCEALWLIAEPLWLIGEPKWLIADPLWLKAEP